MNIFEQIIYGLSAKMETPQGYGAFHLISFGIIIALTAVVCLTLGKASQKAEKILLMTVWAVLILWEAYRQLVYAAHFEETVYWDYQWESFPFQFCSSPLFLLPLAALPKNVLGRQTAARGKNDNKAISAGRRDVRRDGRAGAYNEPFIPPRHRRDLQYVLHRAELSLLARHPRRDIS